MTWIPDIVSVIIAVSIPFKTSISKEPVLPLKYFLLIVIYIAHLIIGFLLNDISGWTILSGLRIYGKFLPILLLPLIFSLNEKEFRRFATFVLICAMLQLPVVLFQRFVAYATAPGGDRMGGTLGHSASGILAVFLMIVISYLIAYYYKERLSLIFFIPALICAFLPVTMNETKISFVLLPFAFLFPALFVKARIENLIRIFWVMVLLVVAFISLFFIYNYFISKIWGFGIDRWIQTPRQLESYSVRRTFPFEETYKRLSKDARYVTFGVGAGNVSEGFTPRLNGKYVNEGIYYRLYLASITSMIWEIGLVGTILFLLFPFFIFIDAVRLCKREDYTGAFALGMISFSAFFVISSFYTNSFKQNLFVYLFFFAGGFVIRQTMLPQNDKNMTSVTMSERNSEIGSASTF